MATVPPAIRTALQAALQPLSKHAAALPDPLPVGGRAIRLSDPAASGSREDIRVLAGHDASGYYLDYFRTRTEVSMHGRIRQDGSLEKLENYDGQFGIDVSVNPADTEREKQRVADHNTHVRAVLRQKGFES